MTDYSNHEELPPSWVPEDVGAWLDGDRRPWPTTLGARSDGVYLLYPGKTHSVVAETESGKTWLALLWCAQEIEAGHDVLFLDFEDSIGSILGRLTELTEDEDGIREHFRYYSPDQILEDAEGFARENKTASLVIADGVTELMYLYQMDSDKDMAAAALGVIVKPMLKNGSAVVYLDHFPKDAATRGRYAKGTVQKLNSITGAGYILASNEPFGIGMKGRSTLTVAKDRPGLVRQTGHPTGKGSERRVQVAELLIDSTDPTCVSKVSLEYEGSTEFRPTNLMEKASRAAEAHGEPVSKTELYAMFDGKTTGKQTAVAVLVKEGYLEQSQDGLKHMLRHVKSFRQPSMQGNLEDI